MTSLCEGGNESPGSLKAIRSDLTRLVGRKVIAERRSEIGSVSARAEMVRSEVTKKNDEFITENGEVDVSGTETAKEEITKDLVNKLKYELEEWNRKLDKKIEVMKVGEEYGGRG
ncbi:hypothetical protein ANN_19086 [Periplaneta americana]|uniref:Uncharacterized protein n=1 Tax=Periplaneta americana TaxID=6978 RepID=A0ABQ8SQH8_PERAM|nr:hypothetical protein ANN_19086 [Periplaneta americana]